MSPASESPLRGTSPFRRKRLRPGKPLGPKRILIFLLKLFVFIHLGYIIVTSTFILAYKFTDPVFTVLMPYRSIGYGWKLQKPIPVTLKQVPAYVRNMLVSVEDGKFYTHHGIDMEAFKRAQEINERVGKPLYGGSTLTMQVARTLFLVPEKSYVRKYFEVITALELEIILSKDRILELYFGYAEWGKGIFGIEAAAMHYYKRGVAALSRDEAARLIALLSSPIKYTPSTLNKSAILRERYAYLIRRYVAPSQSASPDQTPELAAPPGGVEPGVDELAANSEPADPEAPSVTETAVPAPAPDQDEAPISDPAPDPVAQVETSTTVQLSP
ncbi:MAG: transglycosylase domain-containing protein [Rectinemataceae bacterium]|nr:transglycosylase domain-containing protein [Rectinemataceae bacterium]